MEKWMVLFTLLIAFLTQTATSYETYPFKNQSVLLINSGAEDWESYEDWEWAPDKGYINTGKTMNIQTKNNVVPGYMNSLRYFPHGTKNCYKVFLSPNYKFLFRAGFYYGNYDGLSKPPTFDLLLDGGFWATVNVSESDQLEPIYKEVLYTPKGESTSVCLVMTQDHEVPFISSIVMAFVYENNNLPVYKLVGSNTALHLVSRTFYGGVDEVIRAWSYMNCDEYTFRIWQPKSVPGYLNLVNNVSFDESMGLCLGYSYENQPPDTLVKNAISPVNVSESISLQVDLGNSTRQQAYFVLYFMDYNLSDDPNVSRMFDIFIDMTAEKSVVLNSDEVGQVVSLYPVEVSGIVNVSIIPVIGTDFPPILNGMEVYTASEIIYTAGGFKLQRSCVFILFFLAVSLLIFYV